MRHRAVIFDLDGTLLDTLDDIMRSANAVLVARGFPPHGREVYRRIIGWGVPDLFARALPAEAARAPGTVAACATDYVAAYARAGDAHTRVFDGIPALLDELARRGLPAAVLSNKEHSLTVTCVRDFLGQWPFAAVQGAEPGLPHKPDPAGAFRVARALAVAPTDVLYLGDTPIDVDTANAAGMTSVAVLWGLRDRDELERARPAHVIAHPLDAVGLL